MTDSSWKFVLGSQRHGATVSVSGGAKELKGQRADLRLIVAGASAKLMMFEQCCEYSKGDFWGIFSLRLQVLRGKPI